MRFLSIFIAVVLLVSCSDQGEQKNENVLKGTVTLENAYEMQDVKIYLYEKYHRTDEEKLLTTAVADENGNFSMTLPKGYSDFNLHITAPNYFTYKTPILNHDDEINVEAHLQPVAIPQTFNAVYITGNFQNSSQKTIMLDQDENGMYFTEVEFSKDTVQYQLITENMEQPVSYPAEDEEFVYDHKGNYKNMIFPEKSKYRFEIDMSKYRAFPLGSKPPKSKAVFSNAPANDNYIAVQDKFGEYKIPRLMQMYYFFVRRTNENMIKDLSEQRIQELTTETKEDYANKLQFADSMLSRVKSSYVKDFLNCSKIIMLGIKEDKDIAKMNKLLDKVQVIPYDCSYIFSVFSTDTNTKHDPVKLLEKFEQKVMNLKNKSYIPDMLYQAYLNFNSMDKKNQYTDVFYDRLTTLRDNYELSEELTNAIDKEINKSKIKKMTKAPEFSFTTLDGKEMKLSDFRGKWVMLDFWATWCAPCRAEVPYIKEAYKNFKDKNFEIIGISADPKVEDPKEFVKENEMNWIQTILLKGYAEGVDAKYAVNAYPTPFLIDPEGNFIHLESIQLRGESLKKTLAKYIDGEDVTEK